MGAQADRPPAACRPFRPKANRFVCLAAAYASVWMLTNMPPEPPQGSIRIISARRATKRERYVYETGSF